MIDTQAIKIKPGRPPGADQSLRTYPWPWSPAHYNAQGE
jgi:hypothetical protein